MNDVMSTWRFSYDRKDWTERKLAADDSSRVWFTCTARSCRTFPAVPVSFPSSDCIGIQKQNLETRFYFFYRCFFPQERVSPCKNYDATPSSRTFIAQGSLSNSSRCGILFSVYQRQIRRLCPKVARALQVLYKALFANTKRDKKYRRWQRS